MTLGCAAALDKHGCCCPYVMQTTHTASWPCLLWLTCQDHSSHACMHDEPYHDNIWFSERVVACDPWVAQHQYVPLLIIIVVTRSSHSALTGQLLCHLQCVCSQAWSALGHTRRQARQQQHMREGCTTQVAHLNTHSVSCSLQGGGKERWEVQGLGRRIRMEMEACTQECSRVLHLHLHLQKSISIIA